MIAVGPPAGAVANTLASLETNKRAAHAVAAIFAETFEGDDGAVSLTESSKGRWRVVVHFRDAPDEQAARSLVAAAADSETAAALRFERIEATDWIRQSLAGLAPVAAGRFVVHGAHDRTRIPPHRIGIEIEAALAFGTGHHGTTRGCLLALDRICKALSSQRHRLRMLDVGTGTGVLAIAAARALRCRVLATDIDATAVRAARANARLNRAATFVDVVQANGVSAQRVRARAPFDLILANILLGPLQRMASPLRRLATPGARVVVSGILPLQANAVIASYRPLALERRFDVDGWTTLVFRRRAQRKRSAHRLQLPQICS